MYAESRNLTGTSLGLPALFLSFSRLFHILTARPAGCYLWVGDFESDFHFAGMRHNN